MTLDEKQKPKPQQKLYWSLRMRVGVFTHSLNKYNIPIV